MLQIWNEKQEKISCKIMVNKILQNDKITSNINMRY